MALKPIPVEDRQGTPQERQAAYEADLQHMAKNPGAWAATASPLPTQPGDALKLSVKERAELDALRAKDREPVKVVIRSRAELVQEATKNVEEMTLADIKKATGLDDLTQAEVDKALGQK